MAVSPHLARVSVPAEGKPPAGSPAVRVEQLDLLATHAQAGVAALVLNAAILCAVLWSGVPHVRLLGWFGLVLAIGALRLVLHARYRRQSRIERQRAGWSLAVAALSFLSGAVWGAAGLFLVPADSFLHQVFLSLLLAGMTAGTIPFMAVVWEAYVLYAVPALLPFALWLVWHGDDLHGFAGALLGVFLAMMLFSSRRHAQMVNETLRLRSENEHLQLDLSDAKVQAHIAAEELQAEMADRHRAQAALWQSEARFQRLIDQAGDAFFLVDADGRICEVNQQACDSLGHSYETLVSSSVRDLFVDLDRDGMQAAWSALESGKPQTVDLLNRRRDGSTFPVEARLSLFDAGGERFVLALVRDVSERKKVERLKNEFISTVSHELRTPLTCIHASLAVLTAEHLEPLPPLSKEMVDIAYKNGEQLIRLINDLLDIQKMESEMMEFRFEDVVVQDLVEGALAANGILADREGVRLEVVGSDCEARVWADRGRLMQVLGNLLSNAIKFSQAGEAVEVSVGVAGGRVRLEVRDQGPGIPAEFQDKVFQKFTQADASNVRQKGGTGLGLSISQMIMERLNGRIGFQSEVGRGSTFWFELAEYRG